ncbi:MAG: hypothetical protein AABM66_08305 [Actinomycetota bacterium]
MKARAMQVRRLGARVRAAGGGRATTLVVVASITVILCAMAGVAWAQDQTEQSSGGATTTAAARTGYPSLSRIHFDGDFDAGCRLMGGNGGWQRNLIGSDGPGRGAVERTRVAEGRCSARLTSIGSDGRAELGKNKGGPDPHVIYEGLYFVPRSTSSIGNFTQHKQSEPDSEDCYNGGLKNTGGRIKLVTVGRCTDPQRRGQRRFDLGVMPRLRWFAVKVQLRFSNNPRVGFARAWVDRDGPGPGGYRLALRRTGVDAESGDRNGARVKFRTGTYHADRSGNNTVFVDGWHMMCVTRC